jgi:adenylate kinase
MKNIIIIGSPGAGKGTQIERLTSHFHFDVISGSEIAKELMMNNPRIKEAINNGELISDEVMINEVAKRVPLVDKDKGIIFDGFPRTIAQSRSLEPIIQKSGRDLDAVIYLFLDEEVAIDRLSKRKICEVCGRSIEPGLDACMQCGGSVAHRQDDSPNVVLSRIETFLEKTIPIVRYYKNRGLLVEINADQSIEDVTKDILRRINH